MSEHIEKILNSIMELSGSDLIQLRDALLDKMGLSVDALVGVGAGSSSAGEVEEAAPSAFKVIMTGVTADFKKVALIKEIMGVLGVGVADAKKIVESGTEGENSIKGGLKKEEAETLKKSLEAHGAVISVMAG